MNFLTLDRVAMLLQVGVDLPQQRLVLRSELVEVLQSPQGRGQHEGDVAVPDHVGRRRPRACLEALEGDPLETHTGHVEGRRLLRIPDVPVHVVVAAVG